jgi:flavin-dependent dehydrogenase
VSVASIDTCDVLIVGGGPAGSACAWRLTRAGFDVVVLDRAAFPRDKVCAGWITPQILTELALDTAHYQQGRTLQPITGFRTGFIGADREVDTHYDHPVSFGIRRCEFDHYLLARSGARTMAPIAAGDIRKDGDFWNVAGVARAPMLVGAGGHFCPVARLLNPALDDRLLPLVAAQEVEMPISPDASDACTAAPGVPELFFCSDLKGYGWCFRKGRFLSVGLGRLDRHALPAASAEFVAFLRGRGKIPPGTSWRWRGHAYLVAQAPRRRTVAPGLIVIGDAAGLAYARSGEGIRPAIESGLLAADAIVAAGGRYSRERLAPYEHVARERFEERRSALVRRAEHLGPTLMPLLLGVPGFARHVLLDQWFLRAHEPPLAVA